MSTPDHTPQTGQAGTSADRVPAGANAATSEVDAPLLTHARLVQTMSGSQMQVNLRSEDFGRITIHAGYQREAISAQITLDNPQLGASLASHVSAMEQKLAEDHGLRTSITVTGAEAGTTSSGAQGGTESEANQRRPFQQFEARAGLAATLNQQASPAMTSAGSAQSAGPRSSGRLNITI